METRIGTCSLCGGDVMAEGVNGWWSIDPPPAPRCASCGAVTAASQRDTIPMVPVPPRPLPLGVLPDPPWPDPNPTWPWDQNTYKVTCR